MHPAQAYSQIARAWAKPVARAWARAIAITAGRGGAWLVGGLIVADAFLVAACTKPHASTTAVTIVLGAFDTGARETGCWFPGVGNTVLADKDSEGKWRVHAMTAADRASGWPNAKVQINMGLGRSKSCGLWSPWYVTEHGRSAYCNWLGGFADETDEQSLRQALIDAWPALAAVAGAEYAQTPLRQEEIEALMRGDQSERTSINWLWLANDMFVLTLGVLLCGSQPARSARWRLNARRTLVEFRCSSCSYMLGGLPMSSRNECRCPECGRVNVAVF